MNNTIITNCLFTILCLFYLLCVLIRSGSSMIYTPNSVRKFLKLPELICVFFCYEKMFPTFFFFFLCVFVECNCRAVYILCMRFKLNEKRHFVRCENCVNYLDLYEVHMHNRAERKLFLDPSNKRRYYARIRGLIRMH